MKTRFFFLLIPALILTAGCNKTDDDLDWNKQIMVAYVHSFAVSISEAMEDIPDEATRIAYIRRAVDPIKFFDDSSGYLYVYDTDGVNIAHGLQNELQGQMLINFQNSKGQFVVRDCRDKALAGGGFIEFYWKKTGETEEKLKLGYVEMITGTDYWIGSGVYLE